MGWGARAVAAVVAVTAMPMVGAAQEEVAPGGELVSLFFDCQAPGCRDMDYLRREVPFVSWVRDREAADVHVLVTSQQTGGGGRQYTLAFIGLGALEGEDQELLHATTGDATTDEQRLGLAEKLKLGLVRYVAATPVVDQLSVSYGATAGGPGSVIGPGGAVTSTGQAFDDPWDFWTFNVNGNGFMSGEATSRFMNGSASFNADRTTELWKVNFRANFSRFVQQFEIPDGSGGFRTVKETREDWGVNGAVVRSLGPQWALGVRADAGSSTFLNQDFRWSVRPGIEYDFVPYAESSRRSYTVQYLVGPSHWNYRRETIFLKTSETRFQHSLTGRVSLIQPWGRWSTSVTGAQYLHDAGKYSVSISGSFNIRLFRGFSINMGGNYRWIRDQLFISAEGATDAQILLRQRQLQTDYSYFTSFGIQYRFGSIFNNVVNPRFGPSGGGGTIIIG